MLDEEEYVESVEALSWLEKADGKERDIREDPSSMLDLNASLRIVRNLYSAGAVAVYALDVIIGQDYEFAQSIKVMLPTDNAKRDALFTIGVQALREMESPYDEVDTGGDSFTLSW